jgi:hypothetical protein
MVDDLTTGLFYSIGWPAAEVKGEIRRFASPRPTSSSEAQRPPTRHQHRAQAPDHPTDADVKRVRFYNASWRLLGERVSHPAPEGAHHAAGTFFWREQREWFTYDQLLVTGSLLTNEPPYLDEASFSVASGAMFVGATGRPAPFEYNEGQSEGASDHLPVCGRFVILQEEKP